MRPRLRSYGDNSTSTRSPGRIRMKCLRIFPETCASTWCSLSSSATRNMALGRVSRTLAITSIASSFAISAQNEFACTDKLQIVARHKRFAKASSVLGLRLYCAFSAVFSSVTLVSTSGPSSVMAMVCSTCTLGLPSSVTTVQPSAKTLVWCVPRLIIGSTAKT